MCIVRRHFVTYGPHCCTICSFYLTPQHLAFVLILYGHIVHVLLSEINDYPAEGYGIKYEGSFFQPKAMV